MNGYLILPLLQIISSFSLMLLVILKGQRYRPVHRLFILVLLCLGLWGTFIFAMRASPNIEYALLWERLLSPMFFFLPATFYHFAVTYTRAQVKSWIIAGLYTFAATSIPLSLTNLLIRDMQIKDYGFAPVFGPLMPVGFFFIFLLSILALIEFYKLHQTSPDSEERTRAGYIMLGITALVVGGVLDILPVFGLPLYPGFIIGAILFALLNSIAILKHNLLDIHVVLRKSAAYFLTTSLFLTVSIILSEVLTGYAHDEFPAWIYILILSAFTLGVPVLFAFFQKRVDEWFFRDRYHYMKALELFSQRTQSLTDQALGQKIVNLLSEAMGVGQAHLLLLVSPKDDLAICYSTTSIPQDDIIFSAQSPLMRFLAGADSPLSYREIEFMPQFVGREKTILSNLGVELIVPGRTARGKLSAVVLLGKKLSLQPYTAEEKQLLQNFVDQMVTKLENDMLYKDAVQMREQLETLSRRLVQIQEDERRGIARELHDEIGQSLVMTKMLLDRAAKSPRRDETNLAQAQVLVKEIIGQVREMSLNLRPSILDDLGLLPAVQWFLDRYTERTGIKVDFYHENFAGQLPGDVRIVAYRVVQEGLNNVAKHARTRQARLSIGIRSGNLHIEIMDEGRGFDPSKVSANSSGLSGMRERVGMIGGTIQVESSPGAGTWLGVDLPLSEGRTDDHQNCTG